MYFLEMTYCPSNRRCIVSVSCIPVPTVEDSNCIVVLCWKGLEESDKASFIINLCRVRVAFKLDWREVYL
jgi:hypothetical protein